MKLRHYRQIPALEAVVLVWQREQRIEVWARQNDDTWTATASGAGETALVDAIGCTLPVDDVYA